MSIAGLQNSRLRIKETSYVKYRNLVYNHILPVLGSQYTDALTTEMVSGFISGKLADGCRDGRDGLTGGKCRLHPGPESMRGAGAFPSD